MSDLIAEGLLEVCDCRSATIARLEVELVKECENHLHLRNLLRDENKRLEAENARLRKAINQMIRAASDNPELEDIALAAIIGGQEVSLRDEAVASGDQASHEQFGAAYPGCSVKGDG